AYAGSRPGTIRRSRHREGCRWRAGAPHRVDHARDCDSSSNLLGLRRASLWGRSVIVLAAVDHPGTDDDHGNRTRALGVYCGEAVTVGRRIAHDTSERETHEPERWGDEISP